MKLRPVQTCLLLAIALPGMAMADAASDSARAARTTAQVPSSERALRQRLDEFKLEGIPLKDAISALRDASGANFFVKWSRLEQAGVNSDVPVTIQVRGTTLAKTLQLILDSVETDDIKLGYYVHENVITISVSQSRRTDLVTRVYDITDLMYIIPDLAPNNNANGTQNTGNGTNNNTNTSGNTRSGSNTSANTSSMRRN